MIGTTKSYLCHDDSKNKISPQMWLFHIRRHHHLHSHIKQIIRVAKGFNKLSYWYVTDIDAWLSSIRCSNIQLYQDPFAPKLIEIDFQARVSLGPVQPQRDGVWSGDRVSQVFLATGDPRRLEREAGGGSRPIWAAWNRRNLLHRLSTKSQRLRDCRWPQSPQTHERRRTGVEARLQRPTWSADCFCGWLL